MTPAPIRRQIVLAEDTLTQRVLIHQAIIVRTLGRPLQQQIGRVAQELGLCVTRVHAAEDKDEAVDGAAGHVGAGGPEVVGREANGGLFVEQGGEQRLAGQRVGVLVAGGGGQRWVVAI